MQLGTFSISLTVKDLNISKTFYQNLGFEVFAGEAVQNWLIMKNGSHVIGLFQGMFEKNIMTFNPGWDQAANKLSSFDDVRNIQQSLLEKGISASEMIDPNSSGPASFMLEDPDGNTILFDQHV